MARAEEIPLVLELMREFYVLEHLRYEEAIARKAVGELMANPSLGRVSCRTGSTW